MLKTILRTVLVILVLAGVFFFALRMWEGKRGGLPTGVAPETPPEASITIRQVSVVPTASGALLQIEEVSAGYTISPLDSGIGFVVDVPGAKVGLLQSSIPNPHPMIRSIDASQVFAQGATHARIRVELAQEATRKDRIQGSTLFVDLSPQGAPTAAPTPEVTPTPMPKPKAVTKPAHKAKAPKAAPKKKTAASKPPRKTTTLAKRTPPPAKQKAAPAPASNDADSDALLRDLGIGSASAPPPAAVAPEPVKQAPPPTVEVAPPPAEAPPAESIPDLDRMFAESQDKPEEASPPPAADTPPKVAAIPPMESGKFDSSLVGPALTGLNVSTEADATVIRIQGEGKPIVKFFPMKDPNRIAVDFQNARNSLKASYPAFAGTRVKKITTQSFSGASGLTRVTIFVDGLPRFEKTIEGNDLVLKLP